MVVLNKIYTRTGDKGDTALGNGARVAKHSMRVTAYGTVDEVNATLGLARVHATGETDAALARIRRLQTRVSRGIRWFRRHSNDIQGRLRQMATQLMRQSRGWWDLARAHVHRFTAPPPAPTRSTGAQTTAPRRRRRRT